MSICDVVALVQRELLNQSRGSAARSCTPLTPMLRRPGAVAAGVINLIMNGIEAMATVTERPRELLVRSRAA